MLRHLVTKARTALAIASPQRSFPCLPDISSPAQLTTLLSFRGMAAITRPAFQLAPPNAPSNAPRFPPWTPTKDLVKRKTLPKRMGHLLQVLENEKEQEMQAILQRPDFGPGDLLELKLSVPENKRRTTVFKGICIARRNRGWRTSFKLRNFIGNSGGIERTFPLYVYVFFCYTHTHTIRSFFLSNCLYYHRYSPHVQEIKIIAPSGRKKKYRRAKLYYLRNVQPKEYRVQ